MLPAPLTLVLTSTQPGNEGNIEYGDGYYIAMVTEFFYPRCGGVETHVLSISQALRKQGCHVVITFSFYLGDYHHSR